MQLPNGEPHAPFGNNAAMTTDPSRPLSNITAVDTHAHVFTRVMKMVVSRRYSPTRDATIADYLGMLDNNGLSHGVLVQVSFLGTDNSYLLQALRQAPTRLRGIVVVEPDIKMEALRAFDRLGVVGVRLNLIGIPDPGLADPEWQGHLHRLAKLHWHVELQAEAHRLPHLIPRLLKSGVRVVVDHFGRPDRAMGIDDPGFHYLLNLAGTGLVWVKLSGAYRNGWTEHGEHAAISAARALVREFGPDRLLWGSDWPHTGFEQLVSVRQTRRALEHWIPSEEDRRSVLVGTPGHLFRFNLEQAFSGKSRHSYNAIGAGTSGM